MVENSKEFDTIERVQLANGKEMSSRNDVMKVAALELPVNDVMYGKKNWKGAEK